MKACVGQRQVSGPRGTIDTGLVRRDTENCHGRGQERERYITFLS